VTICHKKYYSGTISARTGHLGKDSQDKTVRTGQNVTVRIGQGLVKKIDKIN
jgi:hypothetical protein